MIARGVVFFFVGVVACAPSGLNRAPQPGEASRAGQRGVPPAPARIDSTRIDSSVRPPLPIAPGTRFLRIIATNDFHGALEPRPEANGVRRGGAAYVADAIDRARKECAPSCLTLLVDGGDLFQGTPASNLSFGRAGVG